MLKESVTRLGLVMSSSVEAAVDRRSCSRVNHNQRSHYGSSFNCGGGDGASTCSSNGDTKQSPNNNNLNGPKCTTVREVKKRSKNSKSRTLPGRLKLLRRRKSISPPPTPNLSIFKLHTGHPWCLDMDAYGIYMDHQNESFHLDDNNSSAAYGLSGTMRSCRSSDSGNSSRQYRSKSLTRTDAEKVAAQRKRCVTATNSNNSNQSSVSSSHKPSRSRSRSRSRLSNSVFSVSQCFGLGTSTPAMSLSSSNNDEDVDDDELSDCYCAPSAPPSATSTAKIIKGGRRCPNNPTAKVPNSLRVNLDRDNHYSSSF